MFCGSIDISHISIGAEVAGYNGRKTRDISYDGKPLENIQLVKDVHAPMRCPFGIEYGSDASNPSMRFLVDSSEVSEGFVRGVEEMVQKSVNDPTLTFNSVIRPSNSPSYPSSIKLKVHKNTQVLKTKIDGDSMTRPVAGTFSDVHKNSYVVPIVKLHNGVYFVDGNHGNTYGISVVATHILVVEDESKLRARSDNAIDIFHFGDVEMKDA